MKVWRGEGAFLDLLKADPEVSAAARPTPNSPRLFDPAWHFAHVDTIFARVFGPE